MILNSNMSGCIYKIEHKGNIYIGSTRHTLYKRLEWHRNQSKNRSFVVRPMYDYFKSIGWENAVITLVREFESISDDELLWHERMTLEEYNPTCGWNVRKPIRSVEERVAYVNEKNKTYRQSDPLKHRTRCKEWYENNKENKKEKLKEWRQANRDRVNEQQRRRYMEKKNVEQSALLQSANV
jgi:hypothetical protein